MSNDIFEPHSTNDTSEKVGAILKKTRLALGISAEKVTSDLKMRPALLRNIEESCYTQTPDITSLAALVKTYAYYLKLDGQALSQQIRHEAEGEKKEVQINFPEMLPSNFSLSRTILSGLFIVILFTMINFLWKKYNQPSDYISPAKIMATETDKNTISETTASEDILKSTTSTVTVKQGNTEKQSQQDVKITPLAPLANNPVFSTPVDSSKMSKPITQDDVASEQTDDLKTNSTTQKSPLIIKAVSGDSWLEIKSTTGEKIAALLLRKGQSYNLPETGDYLMKAGNASVLVFEKNQKIIHKFNANQHVLKDFSLKSFQDFSKNSSKNLGESTE